LYEQLNWLSEAGFASVDCYWLRAGHAVYGGCRSETRNGGAPVRFEKMLRVAESALA
jgi:hypothetical protein